MTRSFAAGLLATLASFTHDTFRTIVTLGSGATYTDHPSTISFGGTSYTSQHLIIRGIGENLYSEAPAGELLLGDLDSTHRATFFNDDFRGDTVLIRVLHNDAGTWTATGLSYTFGLDADALPDSTSVRIRLASSDAVEGTETPRRTTQEAGCPFDFQNGLCPFRWTSGMKESLKKCDKGYSTPNGCKEHFSDVTQGGVTYRVPKPFGGFRGNMPQSLVLR